MEYLTLYNGFKVPFVGIGTNTFGKVDNQFSSAINMDTKELLYAYDNGYRLVDTAIMYRNEQVIIKSIKDSKLDRKDVIVTSKIPTKNIDLDSEQAMNQMIQSSIDIFEGYVDIYLIHHPSEDNQVNLKIWQKLEEKYLQGQFKVIGVSNFSVDQLNYLMQHAKIKPMMNQIESNPAKWQNELISFCIKNDIAPVAWGPLDPVPNKELLTQIGKAYNKSWAQVLLKYQVMRGVIVIPKSHNKERQFENINIFDFTLSALDIKKIEGLA